MYKKEILIIITDYASLVEDYADPKTRTRWGVVANPVLNNGNYIMPLGWEDELKKNAIAFEVKEVEIFIEEIN